MSEMDPWVDIDPVLLDRRIAEAARRWLSWRSDLNSEPSALSDGLEPLRGIACQTSWERIGEFSDAMPIKATLLRWVYRLTEQRVNAGIICRIASEWYELERTVEKPRRAKLSLAAILKHALKEEPRGDGSWRDDWLGTLAQQGEPVGDLTASLAGRRVEIASRLGLEDREAIESPTRASLAEAAHGWLTESAAAFEELRLGEPRTLLHASLARGANQGWPARLTHHRLADWFSGGDLFEDVDVRPFALPEPLGGMSFLRALESLGGALHEALAPSHQPFTLARDPFGMRRYSFAACLAGVLVNPKFLKRELGLSASSLERHRRSMVCALLIHSRGLAFRVLQRENMNGSNQGQREAFRELGHHSLGVELNRSLYGCVWRADPEDAARYAGFFLAFPQAQQLTEQHDVDWYRNPRALEQLREETQLVPETSVDAETLARAQASAARWLLAELS